MTIISSSESDDAVNILFRIFLRLCNAAIKDDFLLSDGIFFFLLDDILLRVDNLGGW